MSEPSTLAAAHAVAPHDVLDSLDSTAAGLTTQEAGRRLSTAGRNELPAPATVPAWRRFLGHFDDVLIYILLAAGVLKAIAGDWVDFTVILTVAVVNALVGFLQEG
ncbi:MAG: cation-transporting P-type ATPase, partial [Cellulomonas sp.]|nr:cation-transporting P-type ATPase [Cellulomonas sp.]